MTEFARTVLGAIKVVKTVTSGKHEVIHIPSSGGHGALVETISQEIKTLLDTCSNANFLSRKGCDKLGCVVDTNHVAEVTGISSTPLRTEGEVESFPVCVRTTDGNIVRLEFTAQVAPMPMMTTTDPGLTNGPGTVQMQRQG